MLLTRNGRFNSDSFYTEAKFSQDNAYDASLLTAVKNALSQNFGITTKTLLNWQPNYLKTGNLPEDVKKYIKTLENSGQPANTQDQAQPPAAPAAPAQQVAADTAPPAPNDQQPPVASAEPVQPVTTGAAPQQGQTKQQQAGTNQLSKQLPANAETPQDTIDALISSGQLKYYSSSREFDGSYSLTESSEPAWYVGFVNDKGNLQVYINQNFNTKLNTDAPWWTVQPEGYHFGQLAGKSYGLFANLNLEGGPIIAQRPAICISNNGSTWVLKKAPTGGVIGGGSVVQGKH